MEKIELKEVSPEDYAAMMNLMESNRGHGDEPKVGLFWYDDVQKDLFGVVTQPIWNFYPPIDSDGRITCSELHEDVWRKEYNRQKHHGEGKGPFIGAYENKPRGRVFYQMEEDRFIVAVGKWLEKYPDARRLILEEFDLPADKTTFEYAIHWDIGQRWR